jgi:LysR family transcriptional activator of glutamate synthase operon
MAIREMNSLQRGTVRLGVGPTTLAYRLPHVLRDYKRRFPDIDLIVLSGTTEFLLSALRSQHLDLAVVMRTGPQPGLTMAPLGSEELVIVLNRGHALARQRTLDPADLGSLRFILYEKNTAMQALIDRFFESLCVTPRIDMEVENNEAIKSLVRVGLGASILPLCAVSNEPADGQLRILRVKGKPLMRELRLASADAEVLPNAIRELAQALTTALCPAPKQRGPNPSLQPIMNSE